MAFRIHWINLLHRAATSTKKTRTLLKPIGLTTFAAFTPLFVLVSISGDKLLSLPRLLPEGTRLTLSIPFIVVGFAVTAWSAFHFLKVQGTPFPFNPPSKVVNTWPYRYVRNPMLSGVFLFLFGIEFSVNSISLVFFFMPLHMLINVWELKYIEEPELIKRLGNEYIEYRRHTRCSFRDADQNLKGKLNNSVERYRICGECGKRSHENLASPSRTALSIKSCSHLGPVSKGPSHL